MSLLDDFVEHVLTFVDVADIGRSRSSPTRRTAWVASSCPPCSSGSRVEYEIMYPELDGTFPNHPADPLQPANQRDLRARVVAGGFDLGLAFDGDADRVFVVDETRCRAEWLDHDGAARRGDAAPAPGRDGAAQPDLLAHGARSRHRARWHAGPDAVGHSYIKQVMAETGAMFGGEHSAHYYFAAELQRRQRPDRLADGDGRDRALRAAALELRKPFERYSTSGEINTQVDDAAAVIDRISGEFAEFAQDDLDGLTVDCGDWWFNLRPSNTEPLLRLNLEAADRDACDDRVAELLALITT